MIYSLPTLVALYRTSLALSLLLQHNAYSFDPFSERLMKCIRVYNVLIRRVGG